MLADQRVDQLVGLGLAEWPGVGQQRALALGRAALRDGVYLGTLR